MKSALRSGFTAERHELAASPIAASLTPDPSRHIHERHPVNAAAKRFPARMQEPKWASGISQPPQGRVRDVAASGLRGFEPHLRVFSTKRPPLVPTPKLRPVFRGEPRPPVSFPEFQPTIPATAAKRPLRGAGEAVGPVAGRRHSRLGPRATVARRISPSVKLA